MLAKIAAIRNWELQLWKPAKFKFVWIVESARGKDR